MISELRKEVFERMEHYDRMLDLEDANVLDVGTAGDPPRPNGKPGGNYQFFGEGNNYKTVDKCAEFEPDFVADICKTVFPDDKWDLVILSQTLEHIYEKEKALEECYRIIKKKGYLIVDCPWMYPYHAEHDYDDYWRISKPALKKMCEDVGFKVIDEYQSHNLVSLLVRK